jgi:uncharacterized membrane protein
MSDEHLERLERQIGRLLSIGVLLSALALVSGLALELTSARGAAGRVLHAGLVLLVAVPITRILASFVDAVRRRDRLLSISTGIVLAILLGTVALPYLVG